MTGLSPSTFYRYAKNNGFIIVEDMVYRAEGKDVENRDGVIYLNSRPIDIEIFDRLYFSDLESKGYSKPVVLKRNESELGLLARFVLEDILGKKTNLQISSENPIISKTIPRSGMLVNKGNCHLLIKSFYGRLKVGNNKYYTNDRSFPVEEIEEIYLNSVSSWLMAEDLNEYLRKKYFHDEEKNIGFLIENDDFYVFTKIEPYQLCENGKKYQFEEALVGSKLVLNNGKISWNKLVVINKYTHPALSKANETFQRICVGDFDYNSIRQGNTARQVIDLLYNGRKALTRGYMDSRNAWHTLDESIFDDKGVSA